MTFPQLFSKYLTVTVANGNEIKSQFTIFNTLTASFL